MTKRKTAGAKIKEPHWALARMFVLNRDTGEHVIDPRAFGHVAGPPPVGYVCERCTPGVFPDYPEGGRFASKDVAAIKRVQAERFCLAPLYRHCPRCQRVTVHFPMPGKRPGG
jgi:hypothetical protein